MYKENICEVCGQKMGNICVCDKCGEEIDKEDDCFYCCICGRHFHNKCTTIREIFVPKAPEDVCDDCYKKNLECSIKALEEYLEFLRHEIKWREYGQNICQSKMNNEYLKHSRQSLEYFKRKLKKLKGSE